LSSLSYFNNFRYQNDRLKIATLNTNWLSTRKKSKSIFSQNTDILFISETHFTNKRYFRIFKYTLHHTMHPNGKAVLIIRNSIRHYEIGKYQTEYLQITNVVKIGMKVLIFLPYIQV